MTNDAPAPQCPSDPPALPYRNQSAMEACMKALPGLTEAEYKEMAEGLGF